MTVVHSDPRLSQTLWLAVCFALCAALPGCDRPNDVAPVAGQPIENRDANQDRRPARPNLDILSDMGAAPTTPVDVYAVAAAIDKKAYDWPPSIAVRPRPMVEKKDETPAGNPPAAQPADWSSVKRTTPTAGPKFWSAPIDPAAPSKRPLATLPVKLFTQPIDQTALMFSAPESARVVVLSKTRGQYNSAELSQLRQTLSREEYRKLTRNRINSTEHHRIDAYDLYQSEHACALHLPGAVRLLDCSSDGTQVAVQFINHPNRIDVWSIDDKKQIAGWPVVPQEAASDTKLLEAKLLPDFRLLALSSDGSLTVWDVKDRRAIYQIENAGPGPFALTPGRRFAAIFDGKSFRLFRTDNGETVGVLPIDQEGQPVVKSVAFNTAGNRLAAHIRYPGDYILHWNLINAQNESAFAAPSRQPSPNYQKPPPERVLHWCGEKLLMLGEYLCDTFREKVIWRYAHERGTRPLNQGPDDRHWMLNRGYLSVQALPHAEIKTQLKALPDPGEPIFGPGTTLSLKLEFNGDPSERRKFARDLDQEAVKFLTARLAQNGYRVAPSQPLTLVVRANVAATGQMLEYEILPKGSPVSIRPKSTGNNPVVSISEYLLELEVAIVNASGQVHWAYRREFDSDTIGTVNIRHDGDPRPALERHDRESLWGSAYYSIKHDVDLPTFVYSKPVQDVIGSSGIRGDERSNLRLNPSADPLASVSALEPFNFITAHQAETKDFHFSPADDNLIATCGREIGRDVPIKIWDLRKKTLHSSIKIDASFKTVAISPDGKRIIAGTSDGRIAVTTTKRSNRKNPRMRPSDKKGEVSPLVWMPDSRHFLAGYNDGTLGYWSATSSNEGVVLYKFLRGGIKSVVVLPDGQTVIAAGDDGTIVQLNVEQKSTPVAFIKNKVSRASLALSPDGTILAMSGDRIGVNLFDVANRQKTDGYALLQRVNLVRWSPDGRLLALADDRGRISLWDAKLGTPIRRLTGVTSPIQIGFSGNGKTFAALSRFGKDVQLWDIAQIALDDRP